MHISVVVGTRPEIIKMASIIKGLESGRYTFTYDLVHTDQHYDQNLSMIFFRELELPQPHYHLHVGSGTQSQQTANAMIKLEELFQQTKPDIVLVEGDTNAVLAGALSAVKLGIKVGHVEAGLRSYDTRMPEEHNRRVTDHVSSHLFAPTSLNADTLKKENVWGNIFITGNTIIDACLDYVPLAMKNSHIEEIIPFQQFVLVTAHRAENVDNQNVLSNFVKVFTQCPIPIVYPIHPRTIKRLKEYNLYQKLTENKNVKLIEPVGYFDFLKLMKTCQFILTDSGGIQEEATSPNLQKKIFVLRTSTERPEAVKAKYAEVVGTNTQHILNKIKAFIDHPQINGKSSPYGDGRSGQKILDILTHENSSLSLAKS